MAFEDRAERGHRCRAAGSAEKAGRGYGKRHTDGSRGEGADAIRSRGARGASGQSPRRLTIASRRIPLALDPALHRRSGLRNDPNADGSVEWLAAWFAASRLEVATGKTAAGFCEQHRRRLKALKCGASEVIRMSEHTWVQENLASYVAGG